MMANLMPGVKVKLPLVVVVVVEVGSRVNRRRWGQPIFGRFRNDQGDVLVVMVAASLVVGVAGQVRRRRDHLTKPALVPVDRRNLRRGCSDANAVGSVEEGEVPAGVVRLGPAEPAGRWGQGLLLVQVILVRTRGHHGHGRLLLCSLPLLGPQVVRLLDDVLEVVFK